MLYNFITCFGSINSYEKHSKLSKHSLILQIILFNFYVDNDSAPLKIQLTGKGVIRKWGPKDWLKSWYLIERKTRQRKNSSDSDWEVQRQKETK